MSVYLFPIFIKKDLRGDSPNIELFGLLRVLPDIYKDDVGPAFILLFQLHHDRCHHLAWQT